MRESWSREENEVVVGEYLTMLEQELTHQSYTKARANERVQQATGRGKGSVEFKFANISAAMRDIHAPYVDGYKPRDNYQADLAAVVDAALAARPWLAELMHRSVTEEARPRVDFQWDVRPAPLFEAFASSGRRPTPLHTDFVALEAANRRLGQAGEILVLNRERSELERHGRSDLADLVRHVSAEDGDGLGYDISSFTPAGEPRLIEVKTTRRGSLWPMIVTRNEVAVSRDVEESYVLARVFNFAASTVGLYELPGAIEDTCILEAETWRALPRASGQ